MKTVYLCGGINGLSDDECRNWRETTKQALSACFIFLDPMRRDYRGQEAESVNEIVHGDIADIQASDIILANATKPSWGTAMEIRFAFTAGKVILAVAVPPISPWLAYHSSGGIVPSLESAIDHLRRLA